MQPEALEAALSEFVSRLAARLGDGLTSVVLFGSQFRGDVGPDSAYSSDKSGLSRIYGSIPNQLDVILNWTPDRKETRGRGQLTQ